MNKLLCVAVTMAAALATTDAFALTIGANRFLGTVAPGTPADEDTEAAMINGLLEGWTVSGGPAVLGYNDGAASGSVLGNNPNDAQTESYVLRFSADTVIPNPANLASTPGYKTETSVGTVNLGSYKYEWAVVKYGQNSEIYYIGGLTGTITFTPLFFTSGGNGQSHYTLFNRSTVPDPIPTADGGATVALLGSGLLGLAMVRRKIS